MAGGAGRRGQVSRLRLRKTFVMTKQPEFKQLSHLDPDLNDQASRTLNAERLIGRWVNTNRDTQGLSEVVIEQEGELFTVRAVGVGEDGPIAWPEAEATVLMNLEEEGGQRAIAFAATFDLGYMKMQAQIRVNKGVLAPVLFTRFLDDSGRADYVTREFFSRPH